jgi:hypothetical protein
MASEVLPNPRLPGTIQKPDDGRFASWPADDLYREVDAVGHRQRARNLTPMAVG